jgi:uncharacterized membrane protein
MTKLQNQYVVDEAVGPAAAVIPILTATSTTVSQYSGPIPSPEALARYNEIVPGAAAQLIEWANRQATHRQSLEDFAVRHEAKRSWWGLAAGFAIAISAVAGGVLCILNGHDVAGASLVGTSLVGIVTTFVVGTVSRGLERRDRARMLTGEKMRRIKKR